MIDKRRNMKFQVEVFPMYVYKEIIFEVEAEDSLEAEDKAYEKAVNLDQSDLRILETNFEMGCVRELDEEDSYGT